MKIVKEYLNELFELINKELLNSFNNLIKEKLHK